MILLIAWLVIFAAQLIYLSRKPVVDNVLVYLYAKEAFYLALLSTLALAVIFLVGWMAGALAMRQAK